MQLFIFYNAPMYNMDRLFEAVAKRGHVCVGLDTAVDYIPEKERRSSAPEAIFAYNRAIIDATSDIAACFKVQIAYYEELGLAGLDAYARTLKYLKEREALVIADIKRGDIADTASRYARAHFEGDFEADFVTLTPYLGMDSIEPWLEWADKKGKGAFVLMRTSNKGRRDFQCRELEGRRKLYDAVGDKLSELAAARLGKYGYGAFGAVVGADPQSEAEREEAAAIRTERANLFFLIPGYGAQGGAASDAALLLREGNGGVVNASRSILRAWQRDAAGVEADNGFAAGAARRAALEMRDAILKAAESDKKA
uniref:Orotidine 5'-phosphate decarboxylase n=1 Tax=uncultured bacterium contig00101 TaxID=1181568 RepID=A0A806KCY0_9BACT|nr:orotidine-phosphate decarboxylase [uncultured bacterium contig00101]